MISTIYSQKYKDRLYPVVYFSRKIISVELNYNIYNKELLVIIKALRE
jgi:RNase H-like domain found in reverse transcriptase